MIAARIALSLGLSIAAAAPAAAAPFVRTVTVDHARFAACAFSVLDREYPDQITLTDLRGLETIRIVGTITAVGLISSSTQRWLEMEIRKAGKGAVVEVQPKFTIFGDDHYAQRTWKEIQGCLPPA
ncbi:hypothetical protein [Methylobacterium dankookense]|uniref:Uncharacterized protein n=1 Tax=Methylobacterium dankookense TaxID=560405 RepID=A0A564G3W9_9HYPH|nr:hypothetical protein [Methylobacterium dankookense]GJD58686.1 hypothetical protein IFDJLNFL_4609 [Methylobacterium dankookense]VUF15185.1 hypothetical protein MTDSW087_04920 [Methylobacterium dankookense]